MTTIAWDGWRIAADRRAALNDRPHQVSKLHECGEYVYGGTGDYAEAYRIAAWVRAGMDPDRVPTDLRHEQVHGMLVHRRGGHLFLVENKQCVIIPHLPGPMALGSGAVAALAAMYCGKSAPEAIAIAARCDVYTGDGVDCIECGD